MTVYSLPMAVAIPRISAFNNSFPPQFSDSLPAFYDASTSASLTRGELKSISLRLASTLISPSGAFRLTPNDAFLLLSPNHLYFPVVTLAALAAGVPVACASAAAVPNELAHMIKTTNAKVFVVHPALVPNFEGAMKVLGIAPEQYASRTVLLSTEKAVKGLKYTTVESLVANAKPIEPVSFDGEKSKTTAMFFFSSGTTGLPKAVEISHLNLVAQCTTTLKTPMLPILKDRQSILATPLPLFHVAAGTHAIFYPLSAGAATLLWSAPFAMDAFLSALEKYKAATAVVAPPIVLGLLQHPLVLKTDLSNLHRVVSGAAPISGHLLKLCYERLMSTRKTTKGADDELLVCSVYGMSETCRGITQGVEAARARKWDSLGPLLPGIEARLVVDETDEGKGERDAKPGEPGELWVRGDVIMNGYLNNPKATAETITPDKWLRTGDVAIVDSEGFFQIVDRKKELIKYSGYQVPPAELEAVLGQHPAVLDAGVIGIMAPDGANELPKAYVSLRDPKQLGNKTLPAEIAEWFKGRVSHYKALRGGVVLVKAVPRSASGKILRRELRELDKQGTVVAKL